MSDGLSEEPEVIVDTTDRGEGPAPKRTKFTWAFQCRIKYYKAQSQSCMSLTPSNPLSDEVTDI